MKYKILSNRTEEFKQFKNFQLTQDEMRVRKQNERYDVIHSITNPAKYSASWYDRELNKFNAYINSYLEKGFEPYGELKYFETSEKEGLIDQSYKVFMQAVVKKNAPKSRKKQLQDEGHRPINPPHDLLSKYR